MTRWAAGPPPGAFATALQVRARFELDAVGTGDERIGEQGASRERATSTTSKSGEKHGRVGQTRVEARDAPSSRRPAGAALAGVSAEAPGEETRGPGAGGRHHHPTVNGAPARFRSSCG